MIEKLIDLIEQGHIVCDNVDCRRAYFSCNECPFFEDNYEVFLKELQELKNE